MRAAKIFLDDVGEVRPAMDRRLADIREKARLALARQAKEEGDRQERLRRATRIKKEMSEGWSRAAAIMGRVSQTLNRELEESGVTISFTVARTSRVVQFAEAISAFRLTAMGPDFSGEILGEVTLDGKIKHEESIRGLSSRGKQFMIDEVTTGFMRKMLIDFIWRAQSASESCPDADD
jgi:hypothetical protein